MTFFSLMCCEVTVWCFRNLHHQLSGLNSLGSSACAQQVVAILHLSVGVSVPVEQLVSGLNEAQVLDVSSQKEFSERQSDR